MANQMIALQARAPQSSGLGGAIAQNAQMINMMMQQNAAQRQAAQAQQKMDIEAQLAGPQLAEAKSKAFSAEQKALTDFFDVSAKVIGLSKSPDDVRFAAEMLKKKFDSPIFAQMIDQTIQGMPDDPQAFNAWRNQTKLETLDAKDQVPYFFQQVKTKELIGEGGDVGVLTTGGLGAPTIKVPRTLVPAPGSGTGNVEPSVPVDGSMGGPVSADDAERFIQSFPTEAQAAIRERINAGALGDIPMGLPVGPQALVAGERGGVGGPDEGYIEAPTGFRAKNPMQSPTPGVYNVPTSTVRGTSQAEKTGAEEATRLTDLKKALPKAKGALGLATKQLARDIADIDYVLTNPYREMVVGQIEGRLPSAVNIFRSGGQEAQNVQDRLDKINASSVVKHLQQMRDASPQGSSLFGQVTEYEDRLVAALAGLKQTQDEPTFERALREYRNVLVEMYQNLPQVFNDTYGEIGAKEIVPSAAKPPRKSPTIADVEYLRRNRNNPNVVNGFRQHFGDTAYKMAIGGR